MAHRGDSLEEVEDAKKQYIEKQAVLRQQGFKQAFKCSFHASDCYAAEIAIAEFFNANGILFTAAGTSAESYFKWMC